MKESSTTGLRNIIPVLGNPKIRRGFKDVTRVEIFASSVVPLGADGG
jgi:hypothetical protein